jgi:tRNA 2-thiouridine synthesizing protein C
VKKSLSFVFDKPLHGNVLAQEFLDVLLMAAAFDQNVSLFFTGDGVYALLKDQNPGVLEMKNNTPLFDALEIYDVDDVCVEQQSLDERGLKVEQLVCDLTSLSRLEMNKKIRATDHVFSF